jgi:hypothetical protein
MSSGKIANLYGKSIIVYSLQIDKKMTAAIPLLEFYTPS